MPVRPCILMLTSAMALSSVQALGSTPAIELKDLPDSLTLPLPAGTNRMITVVISGGEPSEVWAVAETGGERRVALSAVRERRYQLNLGDPELVRMLRHAGASGFRVHALLGDDTVVRSAIIRCRVVPPPRLDLPGGATRLTLPQRTRKEIPGSEDSLCLEIDDITGGQVLLTLRGSDGMTIIDTRSVRQADELPFEVGSARYVLRVEKLVNLLVGDDYAVFRVGLPSVIERDKIEEALDRVENSGLTFIRNGDEHTAAAAADHLRAKLKAADEVLSYEDFLEQIATRSSVSGRPYQVRLADGRVVELSSWLRESQP